MMIARTRRETRQDRSVLTTARSMYIPTTTATKDQPQRAKPTTAKAIFKIHTMLTGRKVNRRFIIFSACFIISDLFFIAMLPGAVGVIEFRGQERFVFSYCKASANKYATPFRVLEDFSQEP